MIEFSIFEELSLTFESLMTEFDIVVDSETLSDEFSSMTSLVGHSIDESEFRTIVP